MTNQEENAKKKSPIMAARRAAKELGVPENLVRNMMNEGQIAFIRSKSRRYVNVEQLGRVLGVTLPMNNN
jgi:hypothetical protein